MSLRKSDIKRFQSDKRIDPRFQNAKFIKDVYAFFELMDTKTAYKNRKELLEAKHSPELMKQMMKMFQQGVGTAAPPPKEIQFLYRKEGLGIKTLSFTSKPDKNTVKINFVRPDTDDKIPCIVYFHGGGMSAGSAFDPQYKIYAQLLARESQCAVAMIDFRNCETPSPSNHEVAPFPAGLNDCYSGLVYINEHRNELGIDHRIIIAGESGGGNLTISVALLCKKNKRLDLISNGFYAICPYIAGDWPQSVTNKGILGESHLNSTNNGLFITMVDNQNSAMGYGIDAFNEKNILAWPGFATKKDVSGLPRCVIVVDECDPLRDEGINFYRLLINAGVSAMCVQYMGHPHGGEIMIADVPETAVAACRAIGSFAKGVFSKTKAKL